MPIPPASELAALAESFVRDESDPLGVDGGLDGFLEAMDYDRTSTMRCCVG